MTIPSVRASEATDEPILLPTRRWRWPAAADPIILDRLARIENVCLFVSAAIATLVLLGWFVPSIAPILFGHWMLMKVNTAILVLCAALSFALSGANRRLSKREIRLASLVLAAIVLVGGAVVLTEYMGGVSIGIDTFLAADSGSNPGRMSPQTASAMVLLGTVLLLMRVTKRTASLFVDFMALGLGGLVIFIVAGYAFGVIEFLGISQTTRTSPQTLLALILLTSVAFSRRAEAGFFSVLAGTGIGSKIARVAAPLALVLPSALESVRFGLSRMGLLSPKYATALIAALATITGFVMILLLAWRISSLEREIRDLSMRDDLTRLYNRRGFFSMAEVQLRLAQRTRLPFSVLFLDLDGLKHVNDTLGHEAGSEFLKEVATLIAVCFRETDVAGRIGGDEFVVAAIATEAGIAQASSRLQKAADDRNARPDHPYKLQFSCGSATLENGQSESLEAMVKRADESMYVVKRCKEHVRV